MGLGVGRTPDGDGREIIRKENDMGKKLFVGGLSWGTDDQAFRRAFEEFAQVEEAKVITDRDTGRSRGFGFVTYSEDESASKAIEAMNGNELDGRTLTVNEAKERTDRRGGGGGGGGGRGEERGRPRRTDDRRRPWPDPITASRSAGESRRVRRSGARRMSGGRSVRWTATAMVFRSPSPTTNPSPPSRSRAGRRPARRPSVIGRPPRIAVLPSPTPAPADWLVALPTVAPGPTSSMPGGMRCCG